MDQNGHAVFERVTERAMPKYFFHIRDQNHLVPDEEGMEFPDFAAAQAEARNSARDLLAQCVKEHRPVGGLQLEVTDNVGRTLETLPLRDLIT